MLLHALIEDDLPQQESEILEEYTIVFRLGASVRERRTVVDHTIFLSEMLEQLGNLDANADTLKSLSRLQQALADYDDDRSG